MFSKILIKYFRFGQNLIDIELFDFKNPCRPLAPPPKQPTHYPLGVLILERVVFYEYLNRLQLFPVFLFKSAALLPFLALLFCQIASQKDISYVQVEVGADTLDPAHPDEAPESEFNQFNHLVTEIVLNFFFFGAFFVCEFSKD